MIAETISVPIKQAVAITGVGEKVLRAAAKSGDLAVHYVGTKIVVEVDELRAFVRALPTEPTR